MTTVSTSEPTSHQYSELRERFNSHLPKYKSLWLSILAKEQKQQQPSSSEKPRNALSTNTLNTMIGTSLDNESSKEAPTNFLDAIKSGKKVTITAGKQHNAECEILGCLGDCVDPIIEFDDTNDFQESPSKSMASNSSSSSGEDLASMAFDLSHLVLGFDEEDNDQEGLNLTYFGDEDLLNGDEDTGDDGENEDCNSLSHKREEEKEKEEVKNKSSCEVEEAGSPSTNESKEHTKSQVQIENIGETNNCTGTISSQGKENINDDESSKIPLDEMVFELGEMESSSSDESSDEDEENDNESKEEEEIDIDRTKRTQQKIIYDSSDSDKSNEDAVHEEETGYNQKNEVGESASSSKKWSNDEKSVKSGKSGSTTEEEWNDDYDAELDDDQSSTSSSSSGAAVKDAKRRGSFTVVIVSDDDISYRETDDEYEEELDVSSRNSDKEEDGISSNSTREKHLMDKEVEEDYLSDEEEITIEDNDEDDELESDESEFFEEIDDESINTLSSSDNFKSPKTSGRRGSQTSETTKDSTLLPKTIRKTSHKQKSPLRKSFSEVKKLSSKSTIAMTPAAFSRKRITLSTQLFNEFNERAFNSALSSVPVTWSKRLQTTAGITRLRRRGKDKSAAIELSMKVIDDIERLRATLLHEMCHAAQWLVDGVAKPSHGACFKKWANIAMKKIRDVKVTTKHDYVIAYKYAWACSTSGCPTIIKRHSRSVDPKKHCCARCKGTLIEIEVPDTKNSKTHPSLQTRTPRKKRELTGFSLFVQQNSKNVRERLAKQSGGKVLQKEVMKECGRLWKERKDDKSSSSNTENSNAVSSRSETINKLNRLMYDLTAEQSD